MQSTCTNINNSDRSYKANNFSLSVGCTPCFFARPAPSSVTGLVFGSFARFAPDSINNFAFYLITIFIPSIIVGRIAFVVIKPKTTFSYSKQVTAEDYNNSKLYIK